MSSPTVRPSLVEPVAVWSLVALTSLATLVTYARLPAEDLWNVGGSGIEGGLSRLVVHLNFPVSFVAVALAVVAVDRLRTRAAVAVGALSVALCLVTAVPGVVRAQDLDARWVNALPALGVGLALALTVAALRRHGAGTPAPSTRLDAMRVAVAVLVLVVSLPWVAALLGFYLDGPYLSSAIVPEPGRPNLAAVHLGLHHGLDGAVLAWAALALSRVTRGLNVPVLKACLGVYLSLMLVYGLANVVHDFWTEQVYKRGWAEARLPEVTVPEWNASWAVVVGASVALAAVVLYRLFRAATPPAPRVPVRRADVG